MSAARALPAPTRDLMFDALGSLCAYNDAHPAPQAQAIIARMRKALGLAPLEAQHREAA